MAIIKKDGGYMSLPIQIQRGNPIPLDKYAVWYDEALMRDYAKNNPVAYVGQFLSLVNEDANTTTAYMIINVAGDIQEIGAGSMSADGKSIEIVNESIQLKDFGVRYYKYVEGEDGAEGTYELTEGWIAGLEPKVAFIEGAYVLAWYEPNSTTIEGVSSTVASLKTTVDSHSESIADLTSKVNGLGGALRFVDSVADEEALEALDTTNLSNGDVYQVEADGSEWVWNGTEWIELGTNVDLSGYATTSQLTEVSNALDNTNTNLTAVSNALGKATEGTTAGTGLFLRVENLEKKLETGSLCKIESVSINGTPIEIINKNIEIPTFAGATSGLVPVSAGSSSLFLNGAGEWAAPQDSRIGNLTIGDQVYSTVENYVNAAIANAEMVWEPI